MVGALRMRRLQSVIFILEFFQLGCFPRQFTFVRCLSICIAYRHSQALTSRVGEGYAIDGHTWVEFHVILSSPDTILAQDHVIRLLVACYLKRLVHAVLDNLRIRLIFDIIRLPVETFLKRLERINCFVMILSEA